MQKIQVAAALLARTYDGSNVLAKRGQNDPNKTFHLPDSVWVAVLVTLNIVLLLPIFLYLVYTLDKVYPVLAISESRSNYERLPLKDGEGPTAGKEPGLSTKEDPESDQQQPITASFRGIQRHLYSVNGYRTYFKGFRILFLTNILSGVVAIPFAFIPYVPVSVGNLAGSLLTVHYATSWVHWVLAAPSAKRSMFRVPGFKSTFRATFKPTILVFVAQEAAVRIPLLLTQALSNVPFEHNPWLDMEMPRDTGSKSSLVVMLSLVISVLLGSALLEVPAWVILIRTQASLMPEEDETIIPVDRTFGVERLGDRASLTITEVFSSFRGSWARLYKLYVKIWFITIGILCCVGAFTVLQVLAVSYIAGTNH